MYLLLRKMKEEGEEGSKWMRGELKLMRMGWREVCEELKRGEEGGPMVCCSSVE